MRSCSHPLILCNGLLSGRERDNIIVQFQGTCLWPFHRSMLPAETTCPVSMQRQLEITSSEDRGEKWGNPRLLHFLSGVHLIMNWKIYPALQPPEVTWTSTQASEQIEPNLGKSPKLSEQWVSQHEEAWKGLTHSNSRPSPTQPSPAPQEESASCLCLWFLSRPGLPWPGGG